MLEPKKKLMRRTSSEKQNSPNPKITAAKEAAKNAMQGYIGGMASGKVAPVKTQYRVGPINKDGTPLYIGKTVGKAAKKALEKKKEIEKGRPKTGEISVPFKNTGKASEKKEQIEKGTTKPRYTREVLVKKINSIKKKKG
ncbi:MAG: hypothetical protein ACPGSG_02560 [Prolixibacteraceae bacterium]